MHESASAKMNWKTISGLISRKDEMQSQAAKQNDISKLIRIYDCRVTASTGAMVPAEMAERLSNLITALPEYAKRDVVLTGLTMILEICERTPKQPALELRLGAFKSRGQTSLGLRSPLELDRRLTKVVQSFPGVSKRDVIVAGLDLILTKCETINGGPFASTQDQPASQEEGEIKSNVS